MKFRSLAVVGTLLAASLVPLTAVAASATYDGEVCTPTEASTEYIEHPAVGEPTLTIPNPDYQPPVEEQSHIVNHPAVTEVVHHPAETKVVEHEAETHTEYHFAKFTRERTREKESRGWGEWSGYGEWSKYSPETHTSWELGTNPIGSPQFHSSGNHGKNVQWERQWQAMYDGQTRVIVDKEAWTETVTVKEAWDETVVIKEAWDEKIIDVPGKPAVGEPTLTVPNPDYEEAWTETVEHPAVTCPAPPAHSATGEAFCGIYSITLTNEQAEGYENQTASYVVYIDGEFDEAYAVAANDSETVAGSFTEDSGDHTVVVRSGPAQGDELLLSLDVASDCIAPQPEDDVVVEQTVPLIPCDAVEGDEIATTTTTTTTPYVYTENGWAPGEAVVSILDSTYVVTAEDVAALEACPVVTPPAEEKPKPVVKVTARTVSADSTLAQTGGEVAGWTIGGALAALVAGGLLLAARRRA